MPGRVCSGSVRFTDWVHDRELPRKNIGTCFTPSNQADVNKCLLLLLGSEPKCSGIICAPERPKVALELTCTINLLL